MITILQITNVSRAFPLHDQQTAADGAIFESVSLSIAEEVSEKKNKANTAHLWQKDVCNNFGANQF